jgi:hypothetical protein
MIIVIIIIIIFIIVVVIVVFLFYESTFYWHANTYFVHVKFMGRDLWIRFVIIFLCWLQAILFTLDV